MDPTHIIYHQGCPDGFGAAYLIDAPLRIFGEEPVWHPMQHGDQPPDIPEGAHLWLVDFANVEADWLRQMAAHCSTVRILDHHQTAEHVMEELTGGPIDCYWADERPDINDPYFFVLDHNHSGVGLAAEYVHDCGYDPDEILPFWPLLEDRDLWRFHWNETADVFAAVTSYPFELSTWMQLAGRSLLDIALEGQAINRYRQTLIDDAVSKAFTIVLDRVRIPCAACPYSIGSDVAGALAESNGSGVGAYMIHLGEQVQIGLRSRGNGPDVAAIAETYGGGGHKHASGLRLHSEIFDSISY